MHIVYSAFSPKTKHSDQGYEFKNASFQNLLDKYNIKIIFALGHAAVAERFNKTMKNRVMKLLLSC